jgi:hypothetical protein
VPPAVALLNYTSSGKLWRIFCQTGIFAGFSQCLYCIINFAKPLPSVCLDFGDFSSNSNQ